MKGHCSICQWHFACTIAYQQQANCTAWKPKGITEDVHPEPGIQPMPEHEAQHLANLYADTRFDDQQGELRYLRAKLQEHLTPTPGKPSPLTGGKVKTGVRID